MIATLVPARRQQNATPATPARGGGAGVAFQGCCTDSPATDKWVAARTSNYMSRGIIIVIGLDLVQVLYTPQ